MQREFRLGFGTDFGQVFNLRIPRADNTANLERVVAAMNTIIGSGALLSSQGRPVNRHSARLANIVTTELYCHHRIPDDIMEDLCEYQADYLYGTKKAVLD